MIGSEPSFSQKYQEGLSMIIAANWKMNLTWDDAQKLAADMSNLAVNSKVGGSETSEIIIFPPALYASFVQKACQAGGLSFGGLSWGGQATHSAASGAFTGDISATMFASAGAKWQLIGHSERRTHHQESDEMIKDQLSASHEAGLKVVLCVGEDLEQREAGRAIEVVTNQIALACAKTDRWEDIVIAYEPVWAIGTGKVAQPQDVFEMHQAIAAFCQSELGAARRPKILYGGSVKAENAAELFALDYVDGALVGGASVDVAQFTGIVEAAMTQMAQEA